MNGPYQQKPYPTPNTTVRTGFHGAAASPAATRWRLPMCCSVTSAQQLSTPDVMAFVDSGRALRASS
eukprot:7378015-Prymnesium_polylepis.1